MAEKRTSLSSQVSDLAARLDKLEALLSSKKPAGGADSDYEDSDRICALPKAPEKTFADDVSQFRQRLIRWIDKKWVNGTKLRYYFFTSGSFGGGADQIDMVKQGFQVWEDVGIGISFEEVTDISEAEVRIGFLQGDGAWSYIGRDVIDIPGQFERTMNFGWDLTRDSRGVDVPVHEIGHTLGFPHEHQNPFSGIVWDEQAVYDYFGGSPNFWDHDTTFYNILRKLSAGDVEGSDWDPDSIMHYGFPPGLILQPAQYYRDGLTPALGLSDQDIEEVKHFYPPLNDDTNPTLNRFRPESLQLAPGEQKNFTILPDSTGMFTIQTFGRSDTIMVLFEDVNGELRYVDADDDSGTSLNARIHTRLRKDHRYVLRIRLYLNYASGETTVMLW